MALLALLLLWADYTRINGAVIASGQAVVRGNPKVVQSLDGGVVADIRVEDGDFVEKGDLLLKLDPTLLEINRDIYRNRLAETVALRDRLKAEHHGLDRIERSAPPAQLAGLDLEEQYAGQNEIFEARRALHQGKKEQLQERIAQFRNQIDGVEGQIEAKTRQLDYIRQELESKQSLNAKGLMREADVLALQRSEAALLGESVGHRSELARIENSIRDTQMEMLQSDRQMMEEVVTDLRDATTRYEELLLELVTLEKQLDRIDIVAPVDGVVHESQVYTVGGVVPPEIGHHADRAGVGGRGIRGPHRSDRDRPGLCRADRQGAVSRLRHEDRADPLWRAGQDFAQHDSRRDDRALLLPRDGGPAGGRIARAGAGSSGAGHAG